MAYVGSPFEHDLFVSYSHGDDGKGNGSLHPWSVAFADALNQGLKADRKFRQPGQELLLFLDADHRPGHGIDPMAGLTGQLKDHIGASALLVILMSPDYLASKWCTQERDWWCQRQNELGLSSDERIAVVHIWPTTSEKWPSELCDPKGERFTGFAFHGNEPGAPRPIGWQDLPGQFGRSFNDALMPILGRLAIKLEWMKEQADGLRRAQIDAAKLQQPNGQTIYLQGRKDHQDIWERIGMTLTGSDYAVFPGEPDPPISDPQSSDPKLLEEQKKRRIATLSNCDSLLLLGTSDGYALDVDLAAVGRLDRQSAKARTNRLLPCAVLDTVGAPLATPIRKATARNLGIDWLDATQPAWTSKVREWLSGKGAQAEEAL